MNQSCRDQSLCKMTFKYTPQANVHSYFYSGHDRRRDRRWGQMSDGLRLLSGIIVCLQCDDFAVLESPKGALPVRRRKAQSGDL